MAKFSFSPTDKRPVLTRKSCLGHSSSLIGGNKSKGAKPQTLSEFRHIFCRFSLIMCYLRLGWLAGELPNLDLGES